MHIKANPPPPLAKPDADSVAMVKAWMRGMPTGDVRFYANSGSAAVRAAALELLRECLEGPR